MSYSSDSDKRISREEKTRDYIREIDGLLNER